MLLLLVGAIFATVEILIGLSRASLWSWVALTLGILPFVPVIMGILTD
jgi:hypothetical protein